MSAHQLGVAIVGLGYAGSEHLREFHSNARARIAAICDVNEVIAQTKRAKLAVDCHAYDQVLRIAGRAPVAVMGLSTGRKLTWEYDPVATVLIRFDDGSLGRVTTNLEAQMPYAFNLRVFGTKGTIINNTIC